VHRAEEFLGKDSPNQPEHVFYAPKALDHLASQLQCPVCEFITRMQILRETFSANDSHFCPLHLLAVRGYVTRSGYDKKAISREEVRVRHHNSP
jgi:hypothetical protein